MGITEDLADDLAKEVIKAMETLNDENIPNEIATIIGASSATTEEAFLTAMRVRRAEARARNFLSEKLEKAGFGERSE